jgi:nitrogen regulatory protein PII
MKLIIAIIKPFKLEEVKEALAAAGIEGTCWSQTASEPSRGAFRSRPPEGP